MLLLILNPLYPVIASPSPRVILSAANNLTRLRMNSAQQSHSFPRPPGLLQRFAMRKGLKIASSPTFLANTTPCHSEGALRSLSF